MKKFLNAIFFRDDPAAGAAFGWLLSIISGFCFANTACLNWHFLLILRGVIIYENPLWNTLGAAFMILQLLSALYTLFLLSRFFLQQDRSRYKWIFWVIVLAHLAILTACAELDCFRAGGLFCGLLTVAGFNALCIRKHNYRWYIAAIISFLACLPGAACAVDLAHCFLGCGEVAVNPFPPGWRILSVHLSVLFFAVFVFCDLNLWASAVGKRLREVWKTGCSCLLILLILTVTGTVTAALYQQRACKKALSDLENNFQREISAKALEKLYFQNRKTDGDFHLSMRKAWNDFFGTDNTVLHQIISEAAAMTQLPEQYRKQLLSSEAENFGRFFDAPLPADRRDYSPGRLMSLMLADLQIMRQAARFFNWQIRFACENKDHAKAMQAWQRSAVITEYLTHDTSLIAILVLVAVENIRLDGLEMMLSSDILSDAELSQIQQYMQKSAGKIPEINRNALHFEAVFANDTVCGFADGSISSAPEASGAEGLKNYRFLLPGLWYLANCNYRYLLEYYNVQSLCQVNAAPARSPENMLAVMLLPALNTAGETLHALEMRYQAFNILIEAEKIKRKTGKYPEKSPLTITDHFSGGKLRYEIGSHKMREAFLGDREKVDGELFSADVSLDFRTGSVQGIAVWSIGRNRVDDRGLADITGENGNRTDDRRALRIISE